MTQASEAQPTRLQVASVVSFYMVAALVMVFVNKAVLNTTPDLSLSLLLIQLIIAVLLLHLAAFISSTPLRRVIPFRITTPPLDLKVAIKLLPYVTVGVTGLVFNTLCLANVDASFFQIARGLLLPFTIAISAVSTRTRPKQLVLLAALIITTGYSLGVTPSSYFASTLSIRDRLLPLIYGTLSSFLLALHAVLTKAAHSHVGSENSVVKLMYYSNLMSTVFLAPFVLMNGDFAKIATRFAIGGDEWRVFIVGCAITGVFGFMLGVANLLSITVTSPVTHMVSSAARSVLQTILGVYLFGDVITAHRGGSILIITGGALFYTWVQSKRPPPPKVEAIQLPPTPDIDVEKGRR